jgi:hypothetical protein
MPDRVWHQGKQTPTYKELIVASRFRALGIVLALLGFAFVIGAGYAFLKVQDGTKSLSAFSAAQNVQLAYNEDGQLVDRGEVEGAQAIMSLLTDDWGYAVVDSEMDPNDPLVNTASEYMYQMATITYHTLNSVQTVVLPEDVEYKGEVFKAGTYEVPVDGKYWADFDRSHPLEGPARGQAWTGVALALIGELGVGASTASTLQLGLGVAGLMLGLGGTLFLTGLGLVWAAQPVREKVAVFKPASAIA